MPTLDVSELNIAISVFGGFIILFGVFSAKIRNVLYLGEALPAVLAGIILGPGVAKILGANEWKSAVNDEEGSITLGVCRVVIGVQLVIAGYQLPAKYQLTRWKEMFIILIPKMALMWLCTSCCILIAIPDISFLCALVIASCVTSIDPILSQAIAKGPFADKYVARDLREIISSEAGANDGFGFPFLMLATELLRHTQGPSDTHHGTHAEYIIARSGEIGRLGGGVSTAVTQWLLETCLYYVLLGAVYGALVGFGTLRMLRSCVRRKWIDTESYLLFPTALGLFLIGTCGCIGSNDLLACFAAGSSLNWDGAYLAETEALYDEVNSTVDMILNFGGFMFIGAMLPWDEFFHIEGIGITLPRMFLLGVLVLLLRRIPSSLIFYKAMPRVCKNWKEALFMGYFGPIGIGAVFYVEHTRHLFPKLGEGDEEETRLLQVMEPVVYFLVIFSIVVHGLSIPILNFIYKRARVPPIVDPSGPAEIHPLSTHMALPKNSFAHSKRRSVMVYNRFTRCNHPDNPGWNLPRDYLEDLRAYRLNSETFELQRMDNVA